MQSRKLLLPTAFPSFGRILPPGILKKIFSLGSLYVIESKREEKMRKERRKEESKQKNSKDLKFWTLMISPYLNCPLG